MAKLQDVIAYILTNYPHKDELSNARVTKMIYLADWKSAIDRDKQMTNITWYFDNYGPYVTNILETVVSNNQIFDIKQTKNMFGGDKTVLVLKRNRYDFSSLTKEEINILDHVIEKSAPKNWVSFISLVYSTYPITSSSKYSYLNLVAKAREYTTYS